MDLRPVGILFEGMISNSVSSTVALEGCKLKEAPPVGVLPMNERTTIGAR